MAIVVVMLLKLWAVTALRKYPSAVVSSLHLSGLLIRAVKAQIVRWKLFVTEGCNAQSQTFTAADATAFTNDDKGLKQVED